MINILPTMQCCYVQTKLLIDHFVYTGKIRAKEYECYAKEITRTTVVARPEHLDRHIETSLPKGAELQRAADLGHDSGRRPGSTRSAARNDPPESRLR